MKKKNLKNQITESKVFLIIITKQRIDYFKITIFTDFCFFSVFIITLLTKQLHFKIGIYPISKIIIVYCSQQKNVEQFDCLSVGCPMSQQTGIKKKERTRELNKQNTLTCVYSISNHLVKHLPLILSILLLCFFFFFFFMRFFNSFVVSNHTNLIDLSFDLVQRT